MAALRSLDPELVQEVAVWRREFRRRVKDPNVCVVCGETREPMRCECRGEPELYSNDPDDPGWDT